jgi:hypothetical protein
MSDSLNSRWIRWSLGAIVLLLAVIAMQLSVLTGPMIPAARAQTPEVKPPLPDSAKQRNEMLDAQKQTNATLDSILHVLRTQTIKVQIAGTDKEGKRTSAVPPRAPTPPPGAPTPPPVRKP